MTTEHFLQYLRKNLIERNHINIYPDELEEWIYQSGLPDNIPVPASTRFDQVDAALSHWIDDDELPQTDDWSTHEWLHFLRSLPADLDSTAVSSLDTAFNFTHSGNTEIQTAWFEKAISYHYQPAYPAMAEFLKHVGRRKFLSPLYKALSQTESGKQFALEVYEEARPNYHFVSANSIDQILGISSN